MKQISFIVLVSLLLVACQSQTESALPTPAVQIATSPPPTRTPIPTPTLTVEELIYPYTIEGLREHEYQSGEIEILEELADTGTFTSYLIEYPSDGLTITGVMQIPKQGKQPYPVIVMNHGFFLRDDYSSGDGTDRAAEFLNRHGYLTLSSDYRSWGGSDSGTSLFYSGLVIDVINLMNAIPSIPEADSERIGMWGHSMGGGVTFKVLTIDPRVKAAVLYATVSADDADIIRAWGSGCIGDIEQGEQAYYCNSSDILIDEPPELVFAYQYASTNLVMLREIAPFYHFEDISAPVQINYGTEDGFEIGGTPPEWSRKAYIGFMEAGKPAELFAFKDEKHSFIGDQWWAFMERSAHFFDEYVK